MTSEYEDGNNACFKFPFGQDCGNIPVTAGMENVV
jgi:hypothetical protein